MDAVGNAEVEILLVIPAYRESRRLPGYLEVLLPVLKGAGISIGVQVVDDGSPVEEQRALQELYGRLSGEYPFLFPPVFLPLNQGKGAAVYEGWDCHPDCRLLGFVDADGSISPEEVVRLARLALGGGAVFGSRIRMLGRRVERRWSRHIASRIFATLVGSLLVRDVYDSQCGLKFVPSEVFFSVKDRLTEKRFAFDLDLLLRLLEVRCPVREEPIDWMDCEGSKVRFFRDFFQMVGAVVRLKNG